MGLKLLKVTPWGLVTGHLVQNWWISMNIFQLRSPGILFWIEVPWCTLFYLSFVSSRSVAPKEPMSFAASKDSVEVVNVVKLASHKFLHFFNLLSWSFNPSSVRLKRFPVISLICLGVQIDFCFSIKKYLFLLPTSGVGRTEKSKIALTLGFGFRILVTTPHIKEMPKLRRLVMSRGPRRSQIWSPPQGVPPNPGPSWAPWHH